jgi:hypothetical protein
MQNGKLCFLGNQLELALSFNYLLICIVLKFQLKIFHFCLFYLILFSAVLGTFRPKLGTLLRCRWWTVKFQRI